MDTQNTNTINIKALKSAIENNNEGMKAPSPKLIQDYHVIAAKHHVAKLGYEVNEINTNHFIYWMIDAEFQYGAHTKGLLNNLQERIDFQMKKYQAPYAKKADKIGSAAYLLTMIVNKQG